MVRAPQWCGVSINPPKVPKRRPLELKVGCDDWLDVNLPVAAAVRAELSGAVRLVYKDATGSGGAFASLWNASYRALETCLGLAGTVCASRSCPTLCGSMRRWRWCTGAAAGSPRIPP